jgi:protein-disulfide isomerase-like protein with CxxC motif
MGVRGRIYADPACCWSWGAEPALRRLFVEFGDELGFTFVMGDWRAKPTRVLTGRLWEPA